MSSSAVLIAFLGGMAPALVWLFFWLMEDRCQPEPKRHIILCFFLGMLAVPLVLPLERFAAGFYSGTMLLFLWAAFEELFKFGAAYFGALRSRVFDEPLDAVIYLVTAALGFSAAENMLFLFTGPLAEGNIIGAMAMENLRFMGASLLHTLASATIGLTIALAFDKPARQRIEAAIGGVILAVALHTLFNVFILNGGKDTMFMIFMCIWVGIIAALLFTERVKIPARDYC